MPIPPKIENVLKGAAVNAPKIGDLYRGATDKERVFGPKIVVASKGDTELIDYRAKTAALLDPTQGTRVLTTYESLYEFTGKDLLGYIGKKHGELWRLDVLICKSDRLPSANERPGFWPTWESAWEYLLSRV